ncbi:autophagy-related protein 2 homolog A-like, partial [Chiloscyllium plagiosum]|uniref:autophagy-related protein 2 homolog A-like n=1 Tax=Chiloscyllium plagiosum TaxID=36176 RepID=UPI001CB82D8A
MADPLPCASVPWFRVPSLICLSPSHGPAHPSSQPSELPTALPPWRVHPSCMQWGGGDQGQPFHQHSSLLLDQCLSLNEFLDSLGAPLEVTDGFISSISVTIPWSALITENCTVEVTGLQVTCRPKYHFVPGTESPSWSSCMTTSMQLAKECLKEQAEEPEEPTQPLEGLEMFAQTIETVLRRIKVTFLDTIVRVEHTPDGSRTGTALEVHIKRLEYCDEAVMDSGSGSKRDPIPIDIHQPPAFVHKVLQFSGVLLHYEEIPEQAGEPQTSPPVLQPQADPTGESHSFPEASSRTAEGRSPSPLVQIGSCTGCLELTVKFKQNDALPGPKVTDGGWVASSRSWVPGVKV